MEVSVKQFEVAALRDKALSRRELAAGFSEASLIDALNKNADELDRLADILEAQPADHGYCDRTLHGAHPS
jgi:hypothetical protein